MAIPIEKYRFFGVQDMVYEQRQEVKLYCEGGIYDAHFVKDQHGRIRLFWDLKMKEQLECFRGVEPAPSVLVIRRPEEAWSFEILIGSAVQRYLGYSAWLLPWDLTQDRNLKYMEKTAHLYWEREKGLDDVMVNDMVYLYLKSPIHAVTHQCVVNDTGRKSRCGNTYRNSPFLDLQCLRAFDRLDGLRLENLMACGLEGDPIGPVRIHGELAHHLRAMGLQQNQADHLVGRNALFREAERNRGVYTDVDTRAAQTISNAGLRSILQTRPELQQGDCGGKPSPYAAEYVRRAAEGVCTLCGQPGPFLDAQGRPWLDCIFLDPPQGEPSELGSAVVPVCPNCKRKLEVQDNREDHKRLWEMARRLPFRV